MCAHICTGASLTSAAPTIPIPKCPQCRTNSEGKRSCCAGGASWYRKCGNPGGRAEHTWSEGLLACRCEFMPDNMSVAPRCKLPLWLLCCHRFTDSRVLAATTNVERTVTVPITCDKCGTNKFGKRSCCVRGGSWFNECGNEGDPDYDHTWMEGFEVCARKLMVD